MGASEAGPEDPQAATSTATATTIADTCAETRVPPRRRTGGPSRRGVSTHVLLSGAAFLPERAVLSLRYVVARCAAVAVQIQPRS